MPELPPLRRGFVTSSYFRRDVQDATARHSEGVCDATKLLLTFPAAVPEQLLDVGREEPRAARQIAGVDLLGGDPILNRSGRDAEQIGEVAIVVGGLGEPCRAGRASPPVRDNVACLKR